jgi:hypothetical protein
MSQSFCKGILALDDSIRFVVVANNHGSIVAVEYRPNLNPLLTREETAQYAIQAVTRAAMREDFTTKLGPFEYSVGKYAKLTRAVIPIEYPGRQTYLLLSFDVGSGAVGIIENKIMKFLKDLPPNGGSEDSPLQIRMSIELIVASYSINFLRNFTP